jgi:hypothetical protein
MIEFYHSDISQGIDLKRKKLPDPPFAEHRLLPRKLISGRFPVAVDGSDAVGNGWSAHGWS